MKLCARLYVTNDTPEHIEMHDHYGLEKKSIASDIDWRG